MEKNTRIDKWLWAVRLFKTRSIAAEACKKNKILVNGNIAKASRELKVGDLIIIKRPLLDYQFKVIGLIQNRQPAKNVALYVENLTPPDVIEALLLQQRQQFAVRDAGTGRPTKKERREIDDFTDQESYDFDFDEE